MTRRLPASSRRSAAGKGSSCWPATSEPARRRLCRALLEQLDQTTFTSLVLNPFLSVEELLREILLDFGVVSREAVRSGRIASATKHELISTLHEFLLSLIAIRGSGVLIIDEAQHLSPEVLEQIRVISNLETNQSKLLQIVLVGQLNLLDVLNEAAMRQLDQRISLRALLKPLTREEVEAYISHRLSVAGAPPTLAFEPAALDLVHAYSGGVPRVINLALRSRPDGGGRIEGHDDHAGVHRRPRRAAGARAATVADRPTPGRACRRGPSPPRRVALVAAVVFLAPWHRLVDMTLPPAAAAAGARLSSPADRSPARAECRDPNAPQSAPHPWIQVSFDS